MRTFSKRVVKSHEERNDAVRLSVDPTFRLIGSEKVWERGVTLTSTLHWFETDLLARECQRRGSRKAENSPDNYAEWLQTSSTAAQRGPGEGV